MTEVWFRESPVHEAEYCFAVEPGLTIAEILARAETPDWFKAHGGVYLDGVKEPDGSWSVRTATGVTRIDLLVMPEGKTVLPVLLTVAVAALTAGIGAGLLGPAGLGLLGSSFAAGGLGASITAGLVGLGGQLLIGALTAPPKIGTQTGTDRQIGEAGATGNPVVRWELLPNVLGEMLVSPPLLAPPFTWPDGDDTWTEAVVGLEGHYSIGSTVLINGIDAADMQGSVVEIREGGPGDAPRTIAAKTVIEQRDGKALDNFKTESNSVWYERLVDQATPDNSAPPWVYFKTDGTWDKVSFRIQFPQGIVEAGANPSIVPVRIECRKVGDTTWRKLPTFHFWDRAAGAGPVLGEIEIIRDVLPAGPHYSWAPGQKWPILDVDCWTGIGQAFEYKSDDEFQFTAPMSYALIPVMTGSTTSGVTVTASNELFGYEAFRACDAFAFYWATGNNPGLTYFTVDFGIPTLVRSYGMFTVAAQKAFLPGVFHMEGWDGAAWINLDDGDVDVRDEPHIIRYCHIKNPGSYSEYRLAISANSGGANGVINISTFYMSAQPVPGTLFGLEKGEASSGNITTHTANSYARARNVSLHKDGCRVYLDPAAWPAGEYEFRVKRGWAGAETLYDPSYYTYAGYASLASFFDYVLDAGYYTIARSQQDFRSDCQIEVFATHEDVAPFDPAGIAHIAVKVKNVRVDSIAATFTRRQRALENGVWSDDWQPSSNPASQMRDIMLGMSNPDPLPGEIIAEDELKNWFPRCVTEGYSCNAYLQGEAIADVLQMIASCGYASPRMAEVWGVVEDYDTSAEPVTMTLSPLNSEDLGTTFQFPKTPHVVQVEFTDAADDYKTGYALVYADGYDANNLPEPTRTETWQMRGFTTEAAAVARATFDLRQARLRAKRYNFRLGLDGFLLRKGSLVGVASDAWDRKTGFGLVKTVARNGSNEVTSITLDNAISWSVAQTDFGAVTNVDDLADVEATAQVMAVAIQRLDGTVVQKDVTETADGNTATFATPFVDNDIVPGLMVITGVTSRVFRRCRVVAVEPGDGIETRTIALVDAEPAGLF